jgi:hypothetical protein
MKWQDFNKEVIVENDKGPITWQKLSERKFLTTWTTRLGDKHSCEVSKKSLKQF